MTMLNTNLQENNIPTISILGCGWLGFPLAKYFVNENFNINGSTTSESKLPLLGSKGIKPFLINFNPTCENIDLNFFQADILVLNIPPKLRHREGDFHLFQIDEILKCVKNSPIKKIIFISSSSIYVNNNSQAKENMLEDRQQAENKILFDAESKIKSLPNSEHLILRCAGLTGPDRILIRHFAGKKDLPNGLSPVNLIHRDDVIGIISQLIQNNNIWDNTLNVCAPIHPLKKEYYQDLARRYNFEMPYFSEKSANYKIINIEKLQALLNYTFIYPDPMLFQY